MAWPPKDDQVGASWVGIEDDLANCQLPESDRPPPGPGLRPLSQFDPSHLSARPSGDTRFLKTDN